MTKSFRPLRAIKAATALTLSTIFLTINNAHGGPLQPPAPLNSYAANDNGQANEWAPKIASDGHSRWLSGWTSTRSSSVYTGQRTLGLSSSTTTGTTWQAAGLPAINPLHSILQFDLCYAGQDKWVLIWLEDDHVTTAPVRRLGLAVSSDLGQSWSTPHYPAHGTVGVDLSMKAQVQLKSDGAGAVMALWIEGSYEAGTPRIAVSTDYAATWSAPQPVPAIPNSSVFKSNIKLTSAGNNRWLIAYSEIINEYFQGLHAVTSSDLGNNWTPLGQLTDAHSEGYPSFDALGHGDDVVIAVTGPVRFVPFDYNGSTEYRIENTGITVYKADDSLTTFTIPQWLRNPVSDTAINPEIDTDLAVDSDGTWVLYTNDPVSGTPFHKEIWRADDISSTWTLAQTLTVPAISQFAVAGGRAGSFVAVAEQYPSPANSVFNDIDIRAINSTSAGQSWSLTAYANPAAATDSWYIYDTNPDMEGSESTLLACWAASSYYPPGFVYDSTQVRQIFVSRSLNHGRSWKAAQPVPGAEGVTCEIRYNGSGNWTLYWKTLNDQSFHATSTDDGHTWSSPVSGGVLPRYLRQVLAYNYDIVRVGVERSYDGATRNYTTVTYTEVSTDGGNTWHSRSNIHSETKAAMNYNSIYYSDPAVAYRGDQKLTLLVKNVYEGRDLPFDGDRLQSMHLLLAESSDNGRTWTTPQEVADPATIFVSSKTGFWCNEDSTSVAWAAVVPPVGGNIPDADIYYTTKLTGAPSAAKDWALFE